MVSLDRERLQSLFAPDGREDAERRDLVELMVLLAQLPAPPDPLGLHPDHATWRERFVEAAGGDDWELAEEAFLNLYAHLHGHDAPYTPDERARVTKTGGYWNHAGGISPVIKAGPWIRSDTVSADLGAGNGLQGLLMMKLHPHRRSVQVEISQKMVEEGRRLQHWLQIPEDRIDWKVMDVLEAPLDFLDFIYMYRPVRPEGTGLSFYENLAAHVAATDRPVVIFSIADALKQFIDCTHEVFYTDGHLTCFRFPGRGSP